MSTLNDPDTQLDQFFLQLGRTVRAGGAGREGAGRPVRQHGHHVRRDQPRPRRRCSDDREVAAHDRRRDPLLPGPAARSSPTSPTCRAVCARRSTSCRARCRPSTAPSRGHPGPAAHGGAQRPPRRRTSRLEDLFENPNTLLAHPRPADHAHGHAARRGVRGALPDGLQLLQLLRPPARRAPVRGQPAGRHGPEAGRCGRRTTSSRTASARSQLAPWDVPARRRPRRRRGAGDGARRAPTRRPTSRRSTPRATPTARTARTASCAARSRRNRYTAPGPRPTATPSGGNGAVIINNFPILSGGTYKSRELGI